MCIRLVIIVLCSWVASRSVLGQSSSVEYGLSRSIRISSPGFTPNKGVEGSPYIPSDSVQNGWLMYGTKRVPVRLRYNSYTSELEYAEGNRMLIPPNAVTEFAILAPDTMYFHRGFPPVDSKTPANFYQVLFNGRRTKLLRYIYADIKSNTEQMSNDFGKKEFRQREEYYVWIATTQPPAENYFEKLSEGEMKPVTLSKKLLANLFPQNAGRIDQYMADKKIKLKSWAEFVGVLRYLDGF